MIYDDYVAPITGREIIYILIGMGIILLVIFFGKLWESFAKQKQKPHVFFIDPTTWIPKWMGLYDGTVDIRIPVQQGRVKDFWGIRTITNRGPRFIVPSFGEENDIIMWDRTNLKNHVFIFALLIGSGSEGPSVHQQWLSDAFPKSLYDMEDPAEIPPQLWLCKPVWNRQMKKAAWIDQLWNLNGVYTIFRQMTTVYEENSRAAYDQMGSLLIAKLQSASDHLLSQWSYIVDAWNTFHRERTVPLYVLSQLLHISPSKVGYAGLSQALNQGSIQAAAPFIRSIRGVIEELADSLDMINIDKTTMGLMEAKINSNKEELANVTRQSMEYEQEKQNLQNQLINMQNQRNNQPNAPIQI